MAKTQSRDFEVWSPPQKPCSTGPKPIHHGFITTRFVVEERKPLITTEHGKTLGQLVDEHIRDHNSKIDDAKQDAVMNDFRYEGPGYLTSITIDIPRED